MSKKEVLTQLCKGVIEKDGCISRVSCDEIECMDCPLSEFNRIDGKSCTTDRKATLEVAKNFLAEKYSFDKILLMNLKGGIERGTKFISDYNAIEILPNRTLKISSLKEERNLMITPSEMFTMVEPYLTVDNFNLEEEFQILGYEGIFKKIEVYGQIKVARRFDNGEVSVYGSDFLDGEDRLIRVKN